MLKEMARRYGIRPDLDDMLKAAAATKLRRTLGWQQLAALGVGAIVGAGVFSVIGIAAADYAGPAVILSFILAGLIALLAALVYAELSTMIPLGGSAYTYASAAGGELFAWLVAWALILSYGIGNAALASAFSENFTSLLAATTGFQIPQALAFAPARGGAFDLPGFIVVLLITVLLLRPVNESVRMNTILVVVKLAVLGLFIAVALPRADVANLTPFAPFGANGIIAGAAVLFFAFLGFDAISTAAEETKDPQRDLPRGILGSIAIVTVLFIVIGISLTGIVSYTQLSSGEPFAIALRAAELPGLAIVMNLGAIAATLSVLLVFQLATTRIVLALARDGLVPKTLAKLSPKHQTPNRLTLALGLIVAFSTAVVPLGILVIMTNVATFFIFGSAMVALLMLRKSAPNAKRPFKCPAVPWVPALGILSCLILGIYSIMEEPITGTVFIAWMGLGIMVYALYGARNSTLRQSVAAAQKEEDAPAPAAEAS